MNALLKFVDRLSISTKLLFAIGAGFLVSLMVALASFAAITSLSETIQHGYEQDLLGVSHVLAARADLMLMERDLRRMAMNATVSEREAVRKRVVAADASLRRHMDEARRRMLRGAGQKALGDFDAVFPAYARGNGYVITLLEKNDVLADGEATQFLAGAEYDRTMDATVQALDAIAQAQQEGARLSVRQSADLAESARHVGILLLGLGLIVCIGFGLLIGASIRRPLSDLRHSTENLAAGRLEIPVPHSGQRNEIGAMARALQLLQQGAQIQQGQLNAKSFLADLAHRLQHADSREDLAEALQRLHDGRPTKPVNPSVLLDAITEILAKSVGAETGTWPPLPGIDVNAGLATTMNNETLYRRRLIKFRDIQGKFAELFATAQQDPDPAAPERAARNLKGGAANIGARAIQSAAGELEQACSQNAAPEKVAVLVETTLAELKPVIAGLEEVRTIEAPPRQAAPRADAGSAVEGKSTAPPALVASNSPGSIGVRGPELQHKLGTLKILVEDSDSEAGDIINELLAAVAGTPLAQRLQPVAAAIDDVDFDSALELLNQLEV